MKVYLAGPEVFLPDAVEIGRKKRALCAGFGFVGLVPCDDGSPTKGSGRRDRLIYEANVAMIREADFGIFNLSPFRSPSADVGTVLELGMMAGLRKPVFGYTTVTSTLLERVDGAVRTDQGGWRDGNGHAIEDFGNADNLMVDASLALDRGGMLRVDGGGRLDDLGAFEACLLLAARHLGRLSAAASGGRDNG